jgi:hypothetical protein
MTSIHDHYTVFHADKPVASFPARYGKEAFAFAYHQAARVVYCVVRVTRSTVPTKEAWFPARVSMYGNTFRKPSVYRVDPAAQSGDRSL